MQNEVAANNKSLHITSTEYDLFANRRCCSLDRPQLTLANDCALPYLELLDVPYEVREENKLQDRWGKISLEHRNRSKLSECWAYGYGVDSALSNDGQMGFEDTVVLLDRKLRNVWAYAVPELAWDEVFAAVQAGAPEVYVSLVDTHGEEIGRPLFGMDQSVLVGHNWHGGISLYPDININDLNSPRRLAFSPFLMISFYYGPCGHGGSDRGNWCSPYVDIEYTFAVPKEEMRGDPAVQVELVSSDTP